jgi:hypothetical protein
VFGEFLDDYYNPKTKNLVIISYKNSQAGNGNRGGNNDDVLPLNADVSFLGNMQVSPCFEGSYR